MFQHGKVVIARLALYTRPLLPVIPSPHPPPHCDGILMVLSLRNPGHLLIWHASFVCKPVWLAFGLIFVQFFIQSNWPAFGQAPAQPAAALSQDCVIVERLVPPVGVAIPAQRSQTWLAKIEDLEEQTAASTSDLIVDVEVLLKACRFAIEFRELYSEKDFDKVDRLLTLAEERLAAIGTSKAESDWPREAGRQVRGFRSQVDGSVQPVGLVLPEQWHATRQPLPLYVWLHGRGDKTTDLHFLCERLDKDGQIHPQDAIVLHPFGRQCIGYKSAGETDVMEAIDFVCKNYPIDEKRIVLMGFSMGGAGVWHLAAHYGERFVAASTGAGFAETARYQNLKPENYPPRYEQMLWSIYDVPGYTRNLFNLPFVAYSGELDKQIQAARVMEEAFAKQGRALTHLIGPGMGHKYHPETLDEIMRRMAEAASVGQPQEPSEFFIQTQHPRYSTRRWLTIDGMESQYQDTRADAKLNENAQWEIQTHNARRLQIELPAADGPQGRVIIDGTEIPLSPQSPTLVLRNAGGAWSSVQRLPSLRKQPRLSGPIDDAFIDPFLVVLPSSPAANAQVDQWVRCELANFQLRWQSLFRGKLRSKLDSQVTERDMNQYHLILWGDPSSNSLIRRLMQPADHFPIRWSDSEIQLGSLRFSADEHVPLAVYPNPLSAGKYVVFNSGPTFRQAHDRTNSLQNPHLPDWAVVSLSQPPDAESPGKVRAAGFFDDSWQFDPLLTWEP